MIPKIIHYCWFGGAPLSSLALKCIASWRKYCPDYEIVRWDETNYDIRKCKYMSDAYDERKWAFVSDYCRLDVIYEFGGIYLDTDVELIKSLDGLLKERLFCGWESRDPNARYLYMNLEQSVNFGLGYGAESKHPILGEMLALYDSLNFYHEDGSLNLLSCPVYQTRVLLRHGLMQDGTTQRTAEFVVYSQEYFCPQSNVTDRLLYLTKNSFSIHHFSNSWNGGKGKIWLRNRLYRFLPFYVSDKLSGIMLFPLKILKVLRKI